MHKNRHPVGVAQGHIKDGARHHFNLFQLLHSIYAIDFGINNRFHNPCEFNQNCLHANATLDACRQNSPTDAATDTSRHQNSSSVQCPRPSSAKCLSTCSHGRIEIIECYTIYDHFCSLISAVRAYAQQVSNLLRTMHSSRNNFVASAALQNGRLEAAT